MSSTRPEGHLTEEELSDLVDGVAAREVVDHARHCPSCSARLDGWRATVAGLAAGVAVPADLRERAIAAALGSGLEGRAGESTPAGASPLPRGRRDGRQVRLIGALAAAAVVVAAAGLALSHAGGSGGGSVAGTNAASHAAGSSAAAGPSSGSGSAAAPGAFAPAAPVREPDLGSVSGPSALAEALRPLLGRPQPTADSGSALTAPYPAGSPSSAAAAAPTTPGCPPVDRLFAGAQPRLLLRATAVYRSVPAAVYVYQVGQQRRAVVVARSGCAVLAQVPV